MLEPGTRVRHRFNDEIGIGLITALEGRVLSVFFPQAGEILKISVRSDALQVVTLEPGQTARLADSGEEVVVAEVDGKEVVLEDGRRMAAEAVWPAPRRATPIDRLAKGDVDSFEDFRNRLDGLRLLRSRQADGLGSFLGGRIDLFPHQLYAAERATRSLVADGGEEGGAEGGRTEDGARESSPVDGAEGLAPSPDDEPSFVRWLLADEVGLGKTVEACLIMNRLLHTGRIDRALVVAPETLTIQWLGELWRKYHQIFVLIDDDRLKDARRDHGDDTNPFEVYRRAIVSLERLVDDPALCRQAVEAGIDLLVVDEAHHLRRRAGQPGNPAYRALQPILGLGRHALLLTATPLEDDAQGFFRLLQLLRPDELPEGTSFDQRLRQREPLPPCTSATRRSDIGGLPPRQPHPVEIGAEEWQAVGELIHRLRGGPADDPRQRALEATRVARAVASPHAFEPAAAGPAKAKADPELLRLVERARNTDPRFRWLAEQARAWAQAGEKTLIFVAHIETLDPLRETLERDGRVRVGVFHERLSTERRDLEVALFRSADGPSVLISTECGGEGRNFQFCHRLVLFDLPWNPAVVEQRIGRLDRIGRDRPTEIVYFVPPRGFVRTLVDLYEKMGLFEEPLGGLTRELDHVAREVRRLAIESDREVSIEDFAEVLDASRAARNRVGEAAHHQLHRAPYSADMAEEILARVPAELDALTEDVVMRAAARFGFECEAQSGARTWLIEHGQQALVDHLPGVPAGSRFLGTFDRARAVDNEALDFFASGHPLVEGILAELEEGPRGRVSVVQVVGEVDAFGLVAVYRRGADFEVVAIDEKRRRRPDLAELLLSADLAVEPIDAKAWTRRPEWDPTIRRLARALPKGEEPAAVAAFRMRKG